MVGGKYEARNFSGLKVFKGTAYGPAEHLRKRAKRFRMMNKEEMDRYDKKVTQSKGFDVDGCTGCMPGRIVPVPPTSTEWHFSTLAARYAANNCEGTRLEFLSLEKANLQPVQGGMYYVTFTAKDTVNEEIKTYRAKVWAEIPLPVKLHLLYFKEFKPSKKAVTPRKARGSMSSNGSKRSEAKKGTVVQAGGVLAGFTALLQKIKSQNSFMTHAMARNAASKKWKSLSNAEKRSFISEASLRSKS